jgi:predicted DNA-binding transcriptional regulator AlpA
MGREYRFFESEVRTWLESLPAGSMSGRVETR